MLAKALLPQVEVFEPGVATTRDILSYLNVTPRGRKRAEAVAVLANMSYSPGRVSPEEYAQHLKMAR